MGVVYRCLFAVLLFVAMVGAQDQIGAFVHAPLSKPNWNRDDLNVMTATNGIPCTMCKDFIGFLKNVTIEKQTLDDLVALMKAACSLIPHVLYDHCINIADVLPDFIKAYVHQHLEPKEVCAKVCPAPTPPPIGLRLENVLKAKKPLDDY